ncbi:hypothetical protein DFS34DRAFT_622109 [Phlyctochytrium arcticum]|nr:hypothetical protein DFS34DRAFT_622109 [Phlyctochytrium arcticum]
MMAATAIPIPAPSTGQLLSPPSPPSSLLSSSSRSSSSLLFPSNASPQNICKSTPLAQSFSPPTKPSTHPLVLLNPYYSPSSISPEQLPPSPTDSDILSPAVVVPDPNMSCIRIEPFVHTTKNIGGLFIRQSDARRLGLEPATDSADTIYGTLTQFSPVVALVFGRRAVINSVYELPAAFGGTPYEQGIVGIDTLCTHLGLDVAVDRGMVYLQDGEASPYDHLV